MALSWHARRVLVVLAATWRCRGALALLAVRQAAENVYAPALFRLEKLVASQQIPSIPATCKRRRFEEVVAPATPTFDHSLWDAVLKTHVTRDGRVDYAALRRDARFDAYIALLADAEPPTAPLDRLAYHLNAYNALCANLVAQHYDAGLASIRDLSTPHQAVWDRPVGQLGGVDVSLNDIEHWRLRAEWDEPVLHANINCASRSCPDLPRFAFSGDATLPEVMRGQFRKFILDTSKGCAVDAERGVVTLSRIFLWFEDDFAPSPLDVVCGAHHTTPHATTPILAAGDDHHLGSPHAEDLDEEVFSDGGPDGVGGVACVPLPASPCSLRYFEYDWHLNDATPSS